MAKASPLLSARPNAVSVCGTMLQAGQSVTVETQAIGPRERKLAERGKISIRPSNKPGHSQITCTLK